LPIDSTSTSHLPQSTAAEHHEEQEHAPVATAVSSSHPHPDPDAEIHDNGNLKQQDCAEAVSDSNRKTGVESYSYSSSPPLPIYAPNQSQATLASSIDLSALDHFHAFHEFFDGEQITATGVNHNEQTILATSSTSNNTRNDGTADNNTMTGHQALPLDETSQDPSPHTPASPSSQSDAFKSDLNDSGLLQTNSEPEPEAEADNGNANDNNQGTKAVTTLHDNNVAEKPASASSTSTEYQSKQQQQQQASSTSASHS
jgi:hypothetical protein